MSNELQTIGNAEIQTPTGEPSDRALDRILKQAQAMQAAHQLGSALAATAMVPQIYQGKADDATAAILYGAELGLSAIQSLQNVFIVRGKPAIYSRTMVAQVIAAGHFVYEVSASPTEVVWMGRRGDNGVEFTSTWTIDRAKAAGFTSNKLYDSMPIEMLRAKAQAEVCRTLAPDVLLGISYSREELELDQPRYVRNEAAPVAGVDALKARMGLAAPEQDGPQPADEPESGAPADEPVESVITGPQLKKLHAMLSEAGLGDDRAGALNFISHAVGREVDSSKSLTKDEASMVFEKLNEAGVE